MTPAALILTIILLILTYVLPRKYAIAPLLVGSCFINEHSKFFVGISSFPSPRIIILIGLIRIIAKKEFHSIFRNKLDTSIYAFSVSLFIAYVLREGTFASVNYISGVIIDTTGSYIFARALLQTWDDLIFYLKFYAIIMIPIALEMTYERSTHFNLFSYLGAETTSYVREGKYRCEAAIGNPILAGVCGAVGSVTSFSLLINNPKLKSLLIPAIIAGIIITVTAASSGAIMALFYGSIGLGCWYLRNHMSLVRKSMVGILILLALIMKAPIWYLIAKISNFLGGTGWHRAYLLDQAVHYFKDWWLIGISHTGYWMPYQLYNGNSDITNQFLAEGIDGGIITMILFIIVVVRAYKFVGYGLRAASNWSKREQFLLWGVGCVLLAHTATFFSICYYNQCKVLFFIFLAAIAFIGMMGPETIKLFDIGSGDDENVKSALSSG